MALEFQYEDIEAKYNAFVGDFLSCEKNVERHEIFPKVWVVSVPQKDFRVMITCKVRRSVFGFEEWLAVVEEPNGEKSSFVLFEEEIENWLAEQRRLRGVQ